MLRIIQISKDESFKTDVGQRSIQTRGDGNGARRCKRSRCGFSRRGMVKYVQTAITSNAQRAKLREVRRRIKRGHEEEHEAIKAERVERIPAFNKGDRT
jgi:hypothetical protein